MKRILALILCLSVLASLSVGCTQEKDPYVPTGDALDSGEPQPPTQPDTEIPLALAYYPDRSLDPFVCVDATNKMILSLVYQGLFTLNADYEAVPILCNGYRVSRDMRTYIFYIDETATFSDGSPVTPADVVASLQKAKISSAYHARLSHVTAITAMEDGGVKVELNTPYENFAVLMDIPIIKADQIDSESPVGTGPYALENTVSGLRLRRRMAWWCSSSDLLATQTYITLTEVGTQVDVRDSFEAQKTTMVCVDPGNPTYADFRCDYELWDCDSSYMLYLCAGMKSPVFSNDRVRNALTFAIDRDYIVDAIYNGFAQATPLPAAPDSPYYSEKLAQRYTYNPEILKTVIQEEELVGTEITFLVNSDNVVRLQVAEEIARVLSYCGLIVNIRELPQKEFLIFIEWTDFDLYLGQTRLSANMDMTHFFVDGGLMSYGNLANPALYAMTLESLANSGNYYDLHRMVAEDGRICPVLYRRYAVYTQRGMLTKLNSVRDNLFPYTIGVTMADIKLPWIEIVDPDASSPEETKP